MALIYGKPIQVTAEPIIKPQATKTSKVPWWLNLLFSIGITIIASIVTEGIGGVVGALVGGGVDVVGQVTNDVVSGNRNPLTLTADVLLSGLPAISRANKLSKIAENPIEQISRNIGKQSLSSDLDNLAKELQKVENIKGTRPQDFAKDYLNSLAENNRLSSKYAIPTTELNVKLGKTQSAEASVRLDNARKMTKYLRKFNKILSYSDPTYAIKTVVNKLTSPIKRRINAKISEALGKATKFFGKSSLTARKALMHSLIPLNHTVAPWIQGIRLISIVNLPTSFHVEVVFNPILTHNKPPVMLWNKEFVTFIEPFINVPSAGSYYLDKIAWGWSVGEFLRQNSLFLGFTYIPWVAIWIDRVMIFHRTVDRVVRMSKKSYWEKWDNVVKDIGYGATEGLLRGIRDTTFVRTILKSAQTGDKQYIVRYIGRKTKRSIKRRIRNKTNKRATKYLPK